MTPEVEIKFACEPATLEALAARVFTAPARDQRLVAVYYDTPDGRLAANGASLRLRQAFGRQSGAKVLARQGQTPRRRLMLGLAPTQPPARAP
jgi:adenylate cyclase class IV